MKLSTDLLDLLRRAKQHGFSDQQIAWTINRHLDGSRRVTEADIRRLRRQYGIRPVFKSVDTCAGEFEALTPYYYSTYERHNESVRSDRPKIMILGGGPNRIGQGIEFDYCCVQAVFALKAEGYETIMVNSNPETVSTDYDTSDKLYFEPLTVEDVLAICDIEQPDGVIVQLGGQTPLKLCRELEAEGVKIIGTSPDSIDLAEDRDRFGRLLAELGIPQPENGSGRTLEEVERVVQRIGYPVMVRPSYVLGGRAMQTVWDRDQLVEFTREAFEVAEGHPILIDKFLANATEVDVDALSDGDDVVIAAIMEHIEEAGIHSGDSACVIPPRLLSDHVIETIRRATHQLARALKVKGLMNVQYAVRDEEVYVLEVNPRASRTVPYVSKAIGQPIAQYAARLMVGRTLREIGFTEEPRIHFYAVKEAVLPFNKFPGCTVILGPEMRSTGEVMGVDADYAMAFAKSQLAAGSKLPLDGRIFVSVNDYDKRQFLPIARKLVELGFEFLCTAGTHRFLSDNGVASRQVEKLSEGRPNIQDLVMNNEVGMIVNTFSGDKARHDEKMIRTLAIRYELPLFTTIAAARAVAQAIAALKVKQLEVKSLQEYHAELRARPS
ncbi:MAG: Carbamoyl-phosphate synthase large chain [candidate division BRC1 bacterium ADurb.BinA292]|nr:MAG: Carbamoyl-phosphate synthase large chain [candidate division BRC1 bacterium ADurb.BinA292]